MGARGRAPQPAPLRNLRQRTRNAPKKGTVSKTSIVVPKPPPHIRSDADAAACWRTLAKSLAVRGALTSRDLLAYEGLCRAYSRALKADRAVHKNGITIELWDKRLQANPAVAISRQAWVEVRKFAQEFGLTPASKTRVAGMEAADDPAAESEGPKSTETQTPEEFLFRGVVGRIGA